MFQVASQRALALESSSWFAQTTKSTKAIQIEILQTDLIDAGGWVADGSVLFAATIGMDGHAALLDLAPQLQTGVVVITATQPIASEHFAIVARVPGAMNWGETIFYIHRKL